MLEMNTLRKLTLALAMSSATIAASYAADPAPAPAPSPAPAPKATPVSTSKPEQAHGPWPNAAKEEGSWWGVLVDQYRRMLQAQVDLDFAKACGSKQDIAKAQKIYDIVKGGFGEALATYIKETASLNGAILPKKGERQTRKDQQAYDDAVAKVMAELQKQAGGAKLIKACPAKDPPVKYGPLPPEQRQKLIDDADIYQQLTPENPQVTTSPINTPPTNINPITPQFYGPDGQPVMGPIILPPPYVDPKAPKKDEPLNPYPDRNQDFTPREFKSPSIDLLKDPYGK